MSSISIIGTGNMARAIGALAVAGGNTVEILGRDQSKAADLAKALGGGATTGEFGAVPAGRAMIDQGTPLPGYEIHSGCKKTRQYRETRDTYATIEIYLCLK